MRSPISFRMGAAISACLAVQLGGQGVEPGERVEDGQAHDLGDGRGRDLHRQCFGFEARAQAGLARLGGLVAAELLAHPGGFGLEQAAVEVADHALEGLLDRVLLAPVLEGERHRLALGPVQDQLALVVGQRVPLGVEREAGEGAE